MKQTKELLSQQMTRKEFLKLAGLAILTIIGARNFVSLLQDHSNAQSTHQDVAGRGFGSSKFGI